MLPRTSHRRHRVSLQTALVGEATPRSCVPTAWRLRNGSTQLPPGCCPRFPVTFPGYIILSSSLSMLHAVKDMSTADEITRLVHDAYTSLRYKPPQNQYTILAAFVLFRPSHNNSDDNDRRHLSPTGVSYSSSVPVAKVISLATGSKCLPTERFPLQGDALYDSHAEVLARRGARRWLLEEISRMCTSSDADPLISRDAQDIIASSKLESYWIEQCDDKINDGDTTASSSRPMQFHLKPGVRLAMYISTVPCV